MSVKQFTDITIISRHDSVDSWESINPTIPEGERVLIDFYSDENSTYLYSREKIGRGKSFNETEYTDVLLKDFTNVQGDWNQTDSTASDFIKNKPFGNRQTINEIKYIGYDYDTYEDYPEYYLPINATNIHIQTDVPSSYSIDDFAYKFTLTSSSSIVLEKVPSTDTVLFTFDRYRRDIYQIEENWQKTGTGSVTIQPNGLITISMGSARLISSYDIVTTLDAQYISVDNTTIANSNGSLAIGPEVLQVMGTLVDKVYNLTPNDIGAIRAITNTKASSAVLATAAGTNSWNVAKAYSTDANANTLVDRSSTGHFNVATATGGSHPVPKSQMESYVQDKAVIRNTSEAAKNTVYITDPLGNQSYKRYTSEAYGGTIIHRENALDTFSVADPLYNSHPLTKRFAEKRFIPIQKTGVSKPFTTFQFEDATSKSYNDQLEDWVHEHLLHGQKLFTDWNDVSNLNGSNVITIVPDPNQPLIALAKNVVCPYVSEIMDEDDLVTVTHSARVRAVDNPGGEEWSICRHTDGNWYELDTDTPIDDLYINTDTIITFYDVADYTEAAQEVVIIQDGSGSVSYKKYSSDMIAGSIPMRSHSENTFNVGDPVNNQNPVTLNYAENNYVKTTDYIADKSTFVTKTDLAQSATTGTLTVTKQLNVCNHATNTFGTNGIRSAAIGDQMTINNGGVMANGSKHTVNASNVIVGGYNNTINNGSDNALIGGSTHTITANCGFAAGYGHKIQGARTGAVGRNLTTKSSGNEGQFVIGKYNVEANGAFIIGNGTSSAAKNIFVVNWDGTATVSKDPVNNMDVATKQYVDNHSSSISSTYDASTETLSLIF